MLIILLVLVIGSRNAISKLQKDINRMKPNVNINSEDINRMKPNVNINSEAVDLLIPWVEAAQETFRLQGFGSY